MGRARTFALIVLLALCPRQAQASAWAVWEMDAKAPAMAGAVVADKGSPAAIFFNPAGLAGRGRPGLSLSLTGIQPFTEFSGHGVAEAEPGSRFGVNESLVERLFLLPQIYYTRPLGEKWNLGLGFLTPYGLAVEWEDPDAYSGRHIATRTEMKTYFVSAALAWQVHPRLALGLALDFVKSNVELEQAVFAEFENGSGLFFHEVGTGVITGDSDLDFSVGCGLLAELGEGTHLGLAFRSGRDLQYSGEAEFTAAAGYEEAMPARSGGSTSLPLPAAVLMGISRQVTDRLRLEFDFDWIRWSVYDTLTLRFDDEELDDRILPQQFTDGRQFCLGAEYQQSDALVLRGGVIRDESPQPTSSCGPVLPDADRWAVGLGAGLRLNDQIVLDAYELLIFVDERQVRDNSDGYNGDYRSFANVFGFGLSYEW